MGLILGSDWRWDGRGQSLERIDYEGRKEGAERDSGANDSNFERGSFETNILAGEFNATFALSLILSCYRSLSSVHVEQIYI